ncbi:fibroblast growth factor receptor-like 1 [Condylostylus longicornis]|uniref:fibroblast growth factor receptor-like 1 n=1 Tax=Condylostylus longicornis TaxID=2530218 RepID=UPI00244E447F|nr:fibroblast growth factor receptor-like 1 [Condylostylus longicornis]
MKNGPFQIILIGVLYQNILWVHAKEREYFQIFNAEKHEIKQQQIGDNIKFKCELKIHNGDSITGTEIKWYFKPCEPDFDTKSCADYYSDTNWKTIQCSTTPCRILYLENLTESDTGIYKCTMFPYKLDEIRFLNIRLVKRFRLNVKNYTVLPPEFSENFPPKNETALVGDQTVLQCRVNSKVPPKIKWFKSLKRNDNYSYINRRDINNSINLRQINHRIFKYFEKLYELMDTDGEKIISENIYLSKLILNDIKFEDEGFYACVAVNYQGLNIKETYLKVYSDNEIMEKESSDPIMFLMLFSMPLGLISLPLLCWSVYFCRRNILKNRQKYIENDEERELHSTI